MTIASIRKFNYWYNSVANQISPLDGSFIINIAPTLMAKQSIEFINEQVRSAITDMKFREGMDLDILAFFDGVYLFKLSPENDQLFWKKHFNSSNELLKFDFEELQKAITKLELYLDIKFLIQKISYSMKIGGNLQEILILNKDKLTRGYSFEIDERNDVITSLKKSNKLSKISSKLFLAQLYYSTAMAILNVEDNILGSLDSAFIQLFLAIETILETHEQNKARNNIMKKYNNSELKTIVDHLFITRHRYFMHAMPSDSKTQGAINDAKISFEIAKQV